MKRSIHIKDTLFDLTTPRVMGILNVTPDSFSDGGQYMSVDTATQQAEIMINEGASILDIGGYSSRPGADDITIQQEIDRVVPVIEQISSMSSIPISIDTFRSDVARAAVIAGATIVNDISAGEDDLDMLSTVAQLDVPYIMMHKQGTPKTMQNAPQYNNVTAEVYSYLLAKKKQCEKAGINEMIIDPGFGFGKTISHNYHLLSDLNLFSDLGLPVLVGISRKSMIYNVLETTASEALNGTTFLHSFALQGGANILRVHDVKEAVSCIKLWNKMS